MSDNLQKKRTPAMMQFDAIKAAHPDGILFFQMGDFYEMFGDDAVEASKLLGITLTSRNKNGANPEPLAGIPIHAGERYLAELTKLGKTVVIAEQISAPQKGTVVERAVTRIVTPGTTLSGSVLDEKEYNCITAISEQNTEFSIAWADSSTGTFRVRTCRSLDSLLTFLARLAPKEILLAPKLFSRDVIEESAKHMTSAISFQYTPNSKPLKILQDHFGKHTLESFHIDHEEQILVSGMVLSYIIETQKTLPAHMASIVVEHEEQQMHLDWQTVRNLELFQTARESKREGSLVEVLDKTKTAMGGRFLRHALLFPLSSLSDITARLRATKYFFEHQSLLGDIRSHLHNIHDVERLLGRLSLGRSNARDLVSLRASLEETLTIVGRLDTEQETLWIPRHHLLEPSQYKVLETLHDLLDRALLDDPKPIISEGGMIKTGFHSELDELHALQRDTKSHLLAYQKAEQDRTGIPVKIKSTGVFGYFLEVSKSYVAKVPEDYTRKQSLVGAERYTTEALSTLEDQIVHAEDRIAALELSLFEELRLEVMQHISALHNYASFIAELDFFASNAFCAITYSYVEPTCVPHQELEIENGRHPVAELLCKQAGDSFVANSTTMHKEETFHLVTGPNMAGKSTYLRQIALICHMAHVGMYVPASRAKIPLLDRIFTRIGAQDNLMRGQSTFMVEMQETAHILHYATDQSLIILDEIGRGTSTYDGLSIAWALMEYVHTNIGALTLFATHYHELIEVANRLPHAANFSVAVSEQGSGIVFLHAIVAGGASDSYGIDVAALAGLPSEVLASAKEHLLSLENMQRKSAKHPAQPTNQLSFFDPQPISNPRDPKADNLLREVRALDPDKLTPRQAHELLYTLKDLLS